MDVVLIVVTAAAVAAAIGFGVVGWRAQDEQRRRSAARVDALGAAIRADDAGAPVVAVASLFGDAPPGAGRPLLKAIVVGTLGVALIVFAGMTRTAPEPEAPAAATVAPATAPLELVSMRHTRDADALTVTGLVRNPRAGGRVSDLTAVVLAFDRSGTFLASGTASLEFDMLQPGEESPFQVAIPAAAGVGRYRVSFRTDAGVVRHVDRRTDSRIAMTP